MEFLREVRSAMRDRGRSALFSMREDFIAQLDPYLHLVPTRFSTRYRLDLLGASAAEIAIRQPAEEAGSGSQQPPLTASSTTCGESESSEAWLSPRSSVHTSNQCSYRWYAASFGVQL